MEAAPTLKPPLLQWLEKGFLAADVKSVPMGERET
jgi:hypothetical protein